MRPSLPLAYRWDPTRPPPRVALRLSGRRPVRIPQPRVVGWLPRCGLLLRPDHHWRHHKEPFAVNYCITTGWCDPVLTRIRFFAGLE